MKKICIICNNTFNTIKYGGERDFCFACIPNSSPAERKTKLRQLFKQKAVELKGGKCSKCGYSKCVGALHLHHLNPEKKSFLQEVTARPHGLFLRKKLTSVFYSAPIAMQRNIVKTLWVSGQSQLSAKQYNRQFKSD